MSAASEFFPEAKSAAALALASRQPGSSLDALATGAVSAFSLLFAKAGGCEKLRSPPEAISISRRTGDFVERFEAE